MKKRYYRREVYEHGCVKVIAVLYGTKSNRVVHHFAIIEEGVEVEKIGDYWTAVNIAIIRDNQRREQ